MKMQPVVELLKGMSWQKYPIYSTIQSNINKFYINII